MKRGPISYYGGKATMATRIVAMIPPHVTYTEPFFGGGAVFFAKNASDVEVINDMNRELINFYIQIKTNNAALKKLVDGSLHARDIHRDAWVVYNNPHLFDEVKRAWAVWTLANMGFSSMISESFGTSIKSNQQQKKVANKRASFGSEFEQRLALVTIECRDAVNVIRQYDTEATFHYCDPPYFNSDCGHYSGYSKANFEDLLKALTEIKGKFLLSSYPSELLEQYRAKNGWKQETSQAKVTVARKKDNKKVKTEVLTWNY